jgi:ferredoxin
MHESEAGEVISSDCTTCHVILAEDEKNPEILQTLQGE